MKVLKEEIRKDYESGLFIHGSEEWVFICRLIRYHGEKTLESGWVPCVNSFSAGPVIVDFLPDGLFPIDPDTLDNYSWVDDEGEVQGDTDSPNEPFDSFDEMVDDMINQCFVNEITEDLGGVPDVIKCDNYISA